MLTTAAKWVGSLVLACLIALAAWDLMRGRDTSDDREWWC